MKRAMATVAATAAGAVLCAFVLTGCGAARRHADGSAGSGPVAGVSAAPAGGQAAGQTPPAADPDYTATGTAQIDQNLAQIQSQLDNLDSEASKADQSPQDGDGD